MSPISRRQLLRGAGGVTLGLPLLPSLLPREALAQTAAASPPRLVMMGLTMGGFTAGNDVTAVLPNHRTLYPGHDISWGPIPKTTANGKTVVSAIMQADATVLTDALLAKLNVLRGLDNPVVVSNHNACAFGAIGHENDGLALTYEVPSIDQFLAWSPTYNKPGSYVFRSILTGGCIYAWNYQNPATRAGPFTRVAPEPDPVRLFDKVFGAAPVTAPTGTPRKPLVDHVLENYRMIRDSNRRLSMEDRQRLEAHMAMMFDLQRQVNAAAAAGSCARPNTPPALTVSTSGVLSGTSITPASYAQLYQLYNDVVAAAFKCGLTRVAAFSPSAFGQDFFRDLSVNWHNQVTGQGAQVGLSWQVFFEKVFLDLARKLDVPETDGRTYLDNTLMIATTDEGPMHHRSNDLLMITAGSAGGFFKTGNWVDYRNKTKPMNLARAGFAGITVQQFWANVLDAMRIPRSEWSSLASNGGWGPQTIPMLGGGAGLATDYVVGVREKAGDPMPVIV